MKVSKAKGLENRGALLDAAKRLFQERGFDGVGLSDISAAVGLTQGAVYGHFGSKRVLAARTCEKSTADGLAAWKALEGQTESNATAFIEQYFLPEHVSDAGSGCPMAALTSDIRRQDGAVIDVFTRGYEQMVSTMQEALAGDGISGDARRRSLVLIAAMSGCVGMARATAACDPALSLELMDAARVELRRFALA